MDNGQEKWDKLIHLPEEYESNPSIAQSVIEELSQGGTMPTPTKNWFVRKWKIVAACAAAVAAAVCVGIPVYGKLSTPQIVYFEQYELTPESVENPTTFIKENNLDVLYFDNAFQLSTTAATIVKTGELAYIMQESWHLDNDGFLDKVDLEVVIKKNAEFNFYDDYKNLIEKCSVNGVSVQYEILENSDEFNRQVLAKFTYQKKDYFLDIVTELDGVQQLEVYVNMLLNK